MTSPTNEPTDSPSAITPIRDTLRKLGIGPNPLPPDDEVYSSAVVFLPGAPPAPPGDGADLPAS